MSVAAALALAGGPVVGVAAAKVLGGDGQDAVPAAADAVPAAADAIPAAADAVVDEAATANRAAAATEQVTTDTEQDSAASAGSERGPGAAAVAGGVDDLQRALGIPVDGDFGPATERALKRWQRAHRLAVDGVAGPQTREALGLGPGAVLERLEPVRPSRRHAPRPARPQAARDGGGVRGLQRALGLASDGVFGPATEKALKRWQRSHGLAADGVAGPQTRAGLGLGPGRVLERRAQGRRRRPSGDGGGGGRGSVVQRVIAAANRIATKPYRYGGGHGSFDDTGYDCSGSVSYALHGGGLLPAPLDSSGFMRYGRPGPGRRITIYANPGHVYMTIDGRRFDTSARRQSGSRWGSGRSGSGYVVRHPAGL